jgi:Bacterial PH domain
MSYIQKSLGDGERIIAIAHFHWWYSVGAWLALIAPLLLLGLIVLYADDTTRQWLSIAALLLFAFGLIVFFRMMIRKWTTEIGITSHRFVKKGGLVSLHTDEIALPNIEGVRVFQGIGGRIWGYGRLRIEGTGVDAVTLPTIADPVGFRRAIETAKGVKS